MLLSRRSHLGDLLERVGEVLETRRAQNRLTIGLVLLGPALAIATLAALGEFDNPVASINIRIVILLDIVYVLVLVALVAMRIGRMVADRRRESAGSRLHFRLVMVFAVVALAPTVLVAIFATVTLNLGLETWFSERVRTVLGNSLAAAQAYENEHRDNLTADAQLLAGFIDTNKTRYPLISPAELRELLSSGQRQMQRELPEAFIISGARDLIARGVRSYLFDYEPPDEAQLNEALSGKTVIIEDWPQGEFRALVQLSAFADRFLYVTRKVDGDILILLDETQETVNFYNQVEDERGQLLFEFAVIYLGFALIVVLSAVWLGLWFADRLARPVGRLAGAAQRVGAGDLDVRVHEERGDDEIAMLSRIFNRMTEQVKGQRDALVEANLETERRRRLFAAVLSGVTAGVVGLDPEGRIEVTNGAADRMLRLDDPVNRHLGEAVPGFAPLFERMSLERRNDVQDQIHIAYADDQSDFLVRITARDLDGRREGYVVTFDDITDLVSAQRSAAWGDVARRIAHEIKNPLTPIQLSAERLRRKFGPQVETDRDTFDQYADVIIRQTGDLRRIVDEFSRFARMPAPETREEDICALLLDVVLLHKSAHPDIRFDVSVPKDPVHLPLDRTLITQAFTNTIKNAIEAIEVRKKTTDFDGQGVVSAYVTSSQSIVVEVRDNGVGLPRKHRTRLLEPYVTLREKGTGLGLSIVRKIVEEHSGKLDLLDASADDLGHSGALIRMTFAAATDQGSAPKRTAEEA